jgi:rubrerythrin
VKPQRIECRKKRVPDHRGLHKGKEEAYMMSDRGQRNLALAFAAESKASARKLAFALKAEEDGYRQLARLFRAIADGEATHARRYLLSLRGKIGTSRENLEEAQRNQKGTAMEYRRLVQDAVKDGPPQVKKAFSHAAEVNQKHGELLRKARKDLMVDEAARYYVCQICGYISEDLPPRNCPVCHAVQTRFKKID